MALSKLKNTVRLATASAVIVVAVALSMSVAAAKEEWSDVKRIVAVGDVHGDFEQFVAVLRSAGLIDEQNHWSGGETHFVQTGDVPDRGPDTRKIMDLLMNLEREAEKAKGYVHALIGNHESMNIFGDIRYVHAGEWASFAGDKSDMLREKAYKQHVYDLKQSPRAAGLPDFTEAYRQKWLSDKAPGYFEHRKAFAPDGKYGKWILRHNAVIKINDTIFLHAGIGPKYTTASLKSMNRAIKFELRDSSKLPGGVTLDPEGPLWYRGLARNPEADEEAHIEAVLKSYGAKRIVIGHTVTNGAVWPRFDGRVVMIDVGLATLYGGRMACLVIEDGQVYTVHRGKRIDFPKNGGADLLRYVKEAAALDPAPSPLMATIEKMEASLAATASR